MSTLLDRAAGLARPDGDLAPSPITTPVLAAVRAATGSLVAVMVPVVLAWVLGAGGQASWLQAVRFGLALWLLAHHAGLIIDGGHVGLVPLGLAALPLVSCWYAGRRLARTMDARADRIAAGTTRARPAALSWPMLAGFAAAYCLLACLASLAAAVPGLRPISAQALLGSTVVAAVGGGLGAGAYRFGGSRAALTAALDRVPPRIEPWLRPAAAAVAVQLAVGAAMVAVMVGLGWHRVVALHRAIEAGGVGGAVLVLGEVLLLPNVILWACAVTAGPGFAIGAGTSVTLFGTTLGPLPAIPVLAALPAPGIAPRAAYALLAVPVLGGVLAGMRLERAPRPPRLLVRMEHAAGAGLTAGLVMTALAWLSGGAGGPGRLAAVGPRPLVTGAAVAGEVALGALLMVITLGGLPALPGTMRRLVVLVRPAPDSGEASDSGAASGDRAASEDAAGAGEGAGAASGDVASTEDDVDPTSAAGSTSESDATRPAAPAAVQPSRGGPPWIRFTSSWSRWSKV